MIRYSNQSLCATRNHFMMFWALVGLQAFFAGFAEGWLFSRSEPSISENEPCDPLDQAWRPYPGDRTKFLYCEVSQRRFLVGTCQALNGIPKYFDATKQQCVENLDQQQRPEFAIPPTREKRVGERCSANKDCSDGMYCNNGACVCFLNYIEVNLKCIRVSSVCTSTHFYAEQSSGKPRTCVLDAHCAPSFSCDIHPEAPDISFCCFKSADKTVTTNVCGTSKAYTQNGKEVSCSVDLSHCPSGYSCQYNSYMNRHFCCEMSRPEWFTPSTAPGAFFINTNVPTTATSTPRSTPTTVSPLEEVRVHTIALAETTCGIASAPWLYEGYPMPCNPNPAGNCPPNYTCKSRIGSKLYFCCVDPTLSTIIPISTSRPSTTWPVPQAQICSQSAPYLLNGQPLMCISSDPNSCPDGYICETRTDQSQQAKLQFADHHHFMFSNISFCCSVFVSTTPSSKTTGTPFSSTPRVPPNRGESQFSEKPPVCPSWKSEAFKIQDKPVMCIKTDPQSCPNPYTCEYNEPSRVYYCCKDIGGLSSTSSFLSTSISSVSSVSTTLLTPSTPKFEIDGCPPQTAAAVDQKGRIIVCSLINAPPGCPPTFNCLYSEFHSRYQCCGIRSTPISGVSPSTPNPSSTFQPSVIEDGCPSGQRAYKDPSTQQPVSCVASQLDSCPGGYFCQFSAQTNKFQCCGVHAGCPNDNIAYISLVTGAVQYCNQDDKSCPPGYRCDKGQNNQKVCCSSRNAPNTVPNFDTKVCPVGDPLTDVQQKLKLCSDLNLCPFGYTCLPSAKGPVCCPDPQTICTLPVTLGQQCASIGDSKKSTRYYFNTEKGVCQPFLYEGCSGNANNFDTLQECSAFCFQGLCARGLPARFDSNTPLRCSNAKQDCPPDYMCSAAAFGPQGAYVCCPKPDLICTLAMHEGQKCEENGKSQPIIRFFYDSHRGNCQAFSYHGCGGNANNFLSISQCQSFCGGFTTTDASSFSGPTPVSSTTAAPTPASAPTVTSSFATTNTIGILASQVCPISGEYLPPDPLYHSCNPAVPYSCPHGYGCQNATKQTGGFVCCGSPTLHIKGPTCPIGTDVYIHPVTHQPHACTLDRNGCPDKYLCMFSEPLREYFCCSSSLPPTTLLPKAEICADGDPFLYPGTFQPLSCRPGTVCPRGFECKLASNGEDHVCCASNQKPIDLIGDSRDNSPRYARPRLFPVQPSWYPIAGGFQTWNNGMVDANVMTQRSTQFRPPMQPAIWAPGRIGKTSFGPKTVVDQTNCNKSDSRQLGTECCDHNQCANNFCSEYKDTKYCACPRHLLLDFTYDKPRCVNSCSKWREGAFCVPTPPDVPLGLIRLRFGTRLMDKSPRT